MASERRPEKSRLVVAAALSSRGGAKSVPMASGENSGDGDRDVFDSMVGYMKKGGRKGETAGHMVTF